MISKISLFLFLPSSSPFFRSEKLAKAWDPMEELINMMWAKLPKNHELRLTEKNSSQEWERAEEERKEREIRLESVSVIFHISFLNELNLVFIQPRINSQATIRFVNESNNNRLCYNFSRQNQFLQLTWALTAN